MPQVILKVMNVDFKVPTHTQEIRKITYFLGSLLVSCQVFCCGFFFSHQVQLFSIYLISFNSTTWRKNCHEVAQEEKRSVRKTAHGQGQIEKHSEKKIKS